MVKSKDRPIRFVAVLVATIAALISLLLVVRMYVWTDPDLQKPEFEFVSLSQEFSTTGGSWQITITPDGKVVARVEVAGVRRFEMNLEQSAVNRLRDAIEKYDPWTIPDIAGDFTPGASMRTIEITARGETKQITIAFVSWVTMDDDDERALLLWADLLEDIDVGQLGFDQRPVDADTLNRRATNQ